MSLSRPHQRRPKSLSAKKGDDSILELHKKLSLSGTTRPGSHYTWFWLTPNSSKHKPTYPDLSKLERGVGVTREACMEDKR